MLCDTDVSFLSDEQEKAELTQRFATLPFTRTLFGYRGEFDAENAECMAALRKYLSASRRSRMRMSSRDPGAVRVGEGPFAANVR